METTRLSTKGQIVLPKGIRAARAWEPGTEFTVEETEVFPAAVYSVLARGGKWDPSREPFRNPSPSGPSINQGPNLVY